MNIPLYKPFFVLPLSLLLAICLAAIPVESRESQVVSSSERACRFVVAYDVDLSGLSLVPTSDTTMALAETHLVAMPLGTTARLVAVEPGTQAAVSAKSQDLLATVSGSLPLVSLGRPIIVRGRQLQPVIVSPVTGGSVYRTIEIEVSFDGRASSTTSMTTAPDPFFERTIGSEIVNLEQARSFPNRKANNAASSVLAANGIFGEGATWCKLAVANTGLYRVTGAQLAAAGISLTSLSSNSIRLFNSGGRPLPVYNSAPRPAFEEIPVIIEDGGDGSFGANDALYFFGESVDRFIYEAGSVVFFNNNIYTNRNIYWVAIGGSFTGAPARMTTTDGALGTADTTITNFTRRLRAEQDNLLLKESDGHIDSYYDWFWTDETTLSFFVPTVGAVVGDTAYLTVSARTGGSTSTIGYVDLSVNGHVADVKNCNSLNCIFQTTAFTGGLDSLRFDMDPIDSRTPPYFDYVDIRYQSTMTPSAGRIDITLGGFDGVGRVQVIDNFAADPIALDLSDPSQPVRLVNYVRGGGLLQFDTPFEIGSPNRFYLSTTAAAESPSSITLVTPTDLRVDGTPTDLIIITPRAFVARMDEYVDYREASGTSIRVVAVEDIMDNFGWGMYDPTAIRDFLKYAYETWPAPAPSAVLFAGDATYDYLNALGTGQPNYVPSYIHSLLKSEDRAYSDDNYVYFGDYGILDSDTSFITPDRGYDMMTARWPVSSGAQIDVIVDKIKRYEEASDLAPWRNRITFVADDEFGTYDNIPEPFHVTQTETLSRFYTPAHYERRKIYLWEFPFGGGLKPVCNEAIVDAFNNGALIVNYVGHGNPDVWAHERVFTRQTDLPRLTNRDRLPLVFAASCAIGFFDDPTREGMGEALLSMSSGGAIGVLSATRLVYSQDNALFNREVYSVMLGGDSLTMCESVYLAKVIKQYGNRDYPIPLTNDRAYVFFGDPLLRLGTPRHTIEFTEHPDSLVALARSRVSGRVVDSLGSPIMDGGSVDVAIFDAARARAYELQIGGGSIVNYSVPGPMIYRGSAALSGGEFSFEFVTPLDIGFGGNSAHITTYATVGNSDASGIVDSLPVSDVVAETTDSTGPVITIGVAGRDDFRDGDVVSVNDVLTIRISDSSGVNLATELGHGITFELDNDPEQMTNITSLFSYNQDDYTSGELSYALSGVEAGMHTVRVKAWDNANNASSVSFTIDVVTSARLTIQQLLNYPNPMAENTTFFFELTQPVSAFNLEIFTLAGRRIQSLRRYNMPVGSHELYWDGRDADGDRPATGVYIYKATAVSAQGGDDVESFGKLVVVN
ncbi:type IX secretion system sortase PorU [bacterium]|nr:type IX secretion system sortase PorU [bacterium]